MKRINWRHPGLVFLGFGIILVIVYRKTIPAFFVSDDFSFLFGIQQYGISRIFSNYSDTFFIPVFYLFNYITYLLFGLNAMLHNIVNLLMHLLNGFMVFLLVRKVFAAAYPVTNGGREVFIMAFFTGLLFLVNPYQVEVAGWFSARSYLLSVFFTLLAALAYVDYVITGRYLHVIKSLLFLLPAMLSKEIALVLPVTVIFTELFLRRSPLTERLKSIAVYFSFILAYWMLRFMILRLMDVDDWFGGYGASVHLDLSVGLLFHNLVAYLAKFFLLYRYLPEAVKGFPDFFFSWLFWVMVGILIYFVIFRMRRVKREAWKTIGIVFCFFLFSLAPVITLETSFLGNMQSDRYGYIASIPAMFLWVYGAGMLFRGRWHWVAMSIVALLFCFLTIHTTSYRVKAAELVQKIGHELSQQTHKDTVFFVNLPDNYHGAYVLRVGFADYMKLFYPGFRQKTILYGVIQNHTYTVEVADARIIDGKLILDVPHDDSYMMRANERIEELSRGRVKLNSFSRQRVVFDIKGDGIQFFYFNKGRVEELLPV